MVDGERRYTFAELNRRVNLAANALSGMGLVPGGMAVRGPTLFGGYWNAREVNERDFRGGWFHMGDVFVRHEDGRIAFVDRANYMIKSGGENI